MKVLPCDILLIVASFAPFWVHVRLPLSRNWMLDFLGVMHVTSVLACSLILVLASVARVLAVSPSSTNCPPRNQCDFGRLPGFWRDNEWPQWQVVDSCCRLEDLVGRSLSSPANFSHGGSVKASILIFGDSVERITLHDLCEFADPALVYLLSVVRAYNLHGPLDTAWCWLMLLTQSLVPSLFVTLRLSGS